MVLSIGKLGTGQADYYLDDAGGRVDAVESIEGAEEYYLGATEARGVWLGAGSARLGLQGDIDGADLRTVLAAATAERAVPEAVRDGATLARPEHGGRG
jgi:hypothetical protein